MPLIRNAFISDKENANVTAIRDRLSEIQEIQGTVIRTETGKIQFFKDENFVTVNIKGFVEKIESGDGFTLARTSDKRLYLVVLLFATIKVQALTSRVGRIFARGKQLYYEDNSGKLIGTGLLDLSHFLGDPSEEELYNETFEQFYDEANELGLPDGKLLFLTLGLDTAGAIVKDKHNNVHLWSWGTNNYRQCGSNEGQRVSNLRPFNVSVFYTFLPEPEQVACLRFVTVVLTVSKEIFAIGNLGGNKATYPIRKIDIGACDISSILSSSYYSLLVVRKSFGAIVCSYNPRRGVTANNTLAHLFSNRQRILTCNSVIDACINEDMILAKVRDVTLGFKKGAILEALHDVDITCASKFVLFQKIKRACPFDFYVNKVKM
jgi:hypothetical protein